MKSLWIPSLLLSLLTTVVSAEPPTASPPQTQPASQPASQPSTQPSPEAIKALADLAAHPGLRLTNDATSAHEKFSYALAINPPAGGKGQSTSVLVVRDGDHVGVVIGAKGLPCYYMTDGLLIALDSKKPGQLMMHEGGSVQLLFGGKDAVSQLSYLSQGKANSIVLDPASLLTAMATKSTRLDYRPDQQRLGLKTDAGDLLKIKFPKDGHPDAYPIESLMFQSPGPHSSTFAFGSVTPNVVLKKSIATRTADDVRKLGIPIRMLTDAELKTDFFALARVEFGENEEERETAEQLRALFPDDAPVEAK
jgi:hypothetical protein